MCSRRSKRICLLARNLQAQKDKLDDNQMKALMLPKYESTKGTTAFDQQLALEGWSKYGTSDGGTEKNNADSTENNDKIDTGTYDINDSFSEEITSGSEYVPSDDNSEDEHADRRVTPKKRKNLEIRNKSQHIRQVNEKHQDMSSGIFELNNSHEGIVSSSSVQAHTANSIPKIKIISNIKIRPAMNTECVASIADSTTGPDEIPGNSVEIYAAKKNNIGKRVRDKKHSCYYCHKIILHIARHLELKHGDILDVARALAFPKKSPKRKEIFTEITRAGDFHHNCEVIALKRGELILVRRPTMNESRFTTLIDYGPCPNCLGFLLRKHLWHHLKTSCLKKMDSLENSYHNNRQTIAESNAILSNVFGRELSIDFKNHIINTLRDDEVGVCCKNDNLILKFGGMQFEKYGTTQCELIRQSMRQLARLLITINERTSQSLTLSDILTPQKFDIVIEGVKELCRKYQNDFTKRPEFMTPSLALKLGHSLRKCANIERGRALREENMRRSELLVAFCDIMDLEWQFRVSSNALSTLYHRKLNSGNLLPITNDLLKVNQYIKLEMEQVRTSLLKFPTQEKWSRLAKLALCRIILFNKRRAGEASAMTLDQYKSRPSWSDHVTQELKSSLTPYELKLAEHNTIVNVVGKRGRMVPVILTPETKIALDVLISLRSDELSINPPNPYMFPRGMQALTHMRGVDVMRQIIGEIDNLEKPDLITSTKLRKYIATVCQIFDLSENEYDWLAKHLGHDIRVHREFYRLHEDAVELTKVSRLLMVVDDGEAAKFAGKELKEINLIDLPPIEIEDEDEEVEVNEHGVGETREATNLLGRHLSPKTENIPVTKVKPIIKTMWTTDEKEAVLKYFKTQIKYGVVPGKADCEKCQSENICLKNRKWTDIKFCVKNQIAKSKKMRKG